jgi:hypothetical protein
VTWITLLEDELLVKEAFIYLSLLQIVDEAGVLLKKQPLA